MAALKPTKKLILPMINADNGGQWVPRHTYITNVCNKIEKLLDVHLKNYGCLLEAVVRPEIDKTDFVDANQISTYQMLMGSAQWAIPFGRIII